MCLEDTARIPLLAHDGSVRAYTVLDAADLESLSCFKWGMLTGGRSCHYACRWTTESGRKVAVLMHRVLMGLPSNRDGLEVDHINRDTLDNRRANLRIVTRAQNNQNRAKPLGTTSSHRGVYWHKNNRKWVASIKVSGKDIGLGSFESEAEAGEVARLARLRLMPYAVD